MNPITQVALVSGGNRGIGLALTEDLARRGFQVILGSRSLAAGQRAAKPLTKQGLKVLAVKLDITKASDRKAVLKLIKTQFHRLDVLVNNAGVFLDSSDDSQKAKLSDIRKSFEINTLGAFEMCRTFLPFMAKHHFGRVVNVSSGMGQLSEMNGGCPGYRLSKTALNAVTRIFSEEYKDQGILVNSVCPGWVKTRMGGKGAEISPAEGAETLAWLATLPNDGPTGGFFREKAPIQW